ncbi:PIR Superfamily Protein [Plasmodium ovale wallikeri]|uniref:PIR Superfamily Protein n=2 Tax=Plasmodium ovale TaxID=36330 RepID=A0A1A9AHV5_PLAOA|nr:PIR Superfamily Protein [Plasmodium ovale wallikeri]SBT56172.1 PIR Superfamily Protein [Plasmodium ovale wallikeri]SBT73104.1 Plasmodium vivax Vir protein, putative [Plasmodium ovale]
MESDDQDERYVFFKEYGFNYDIYEDIKGSAGDDYESFPNNVIPEDRSDNPSIKVDCLRLNKYLMKFENNEQCQNNNCCEYINYFLNNAARTYNDSKESIFNIYITYMNRNSDNTIMKLCVPNIKFMEQTKYDKIFKLYNSYEICQLFNSNKYNTTACSLAKSCATAYNKILTTYQNPDDKIFCKALKDFAENIEENYLTSKMQCSGESLNLTSYPESCTQLLENVERSTSSMVQQDGMLEGQVRSEEPSDPQGEKMIEILADDTTSPSSFDTTLPISLFSSGAGVLLILLSFYKFTPIGQWLKLRTQGFGGITKNFDEKLYEMQQPTSEYDERNSEYNGYNIAYNSL